MFKIYVISIEMDIFAMFIITEAAVSFQAPL